MGSRPFSLDLSAACLADYQERLSCLAEDSPARWGGMNALAMVGHLRATIALSLGEVEAPRLVPTWIGRPVGLLFLYVFTRWPRGKKASRQVVPALFPAASASFEEERRLLNAELARFTQRLASDPGFRAVHPFLGRITLMRWARLHGLHCRHHFRQFGLAD